MLILVSVASCNELRKERKQTESVLIESLKSPSTYKFISFEEDETETLLDEIEDRVSYYSTLASYDSSKVVRCDGYIKEWKEFGEQKYVDEYTEEREKAQKDYLSNKEIVSYLEKLKIKYSNELDKVTFKTYRITFESMNSFGAMLKSSWLARFDTSREIVAVKDEDSGIGWVLLKEHFFSIPGYYEFINNNK